ncbi:MAG: hypothetical protein J6U21_08235 [Bacteroidales bacterium]|nr:hypothetical protein [Bacteroidales bacterium]
MANFKILTEKRNIILIVVMLCCIGGCALVENHNENKSVQTTKELDQLSKLSSEDEIIEAVNGDEVRYYIIPHFVFDRYESAKDPENKLKSDYLYIKSTTANWKKEKTEKRDKNGNITRQASPAHWQKDVSLKEFGKLYITKGIELEGLSIFSTEIDPKLIEDTTYYKDGHHKVEYEIIKPNQSFAFIAKLGKHKAELGYDGNGVLAATDNMDYLIKKTVTKSKSSLSIILFLAVIAIIIVLFMRVKKG